MKIGQRNPSLEINISALGKARDTKKRSPGRIFPSHPHTNDTPGRVAQSVTCLTVDPGIAILIPARSHSFVEIDHEIICSAILLLPLNQEGFLSVTSESVCTKYWLIAESSLPRKKSVVR